MSVFKKHWQKEEQKDIVSSRPFTRQDYEEIQKHETKNVDTDMSCKKGHAVKGHIPGKLELQYDGVVCDCGNIKFYTEECGCPAGKHLELYEGEN